MEVKKIVKNENGEEKVNSLTFTTSNYSKYLKIIKSLHYTPRGLQNLGNSCYINSVLQILASNYSLALFFSNEDIFYNILPKEYYNKSFITQKNSFLSCFNEFISYIWNKQSSSSSSTSSSSSSSSLNPLYQSIKIKSLKASALTSSLIKNIPGFENYVQQDAHETLIHILNLLHEQTKQPLPPKNILKIYSKSSQNSYYLNFKLKTKIINLKHSQQTINRKYGVTDDDYFDKICENLSEFSIIQHNYQILLKQKIICLKCNYSSVTLQTHYDLVLPLHSQQQETSSSHTSSSTSTMTSYLSSFFRRNNNNNNGDIDKNNNKISLEQCLDNVFKDYIFGQDKENNDDQEEKESEERESEEENNLYYCVSCKNKERAIKKVKILNNSDYLIFNLNRYSSERSSKKNNILVNFPLHSLNLSKYTLNEADGEEKEEIDKDIESKERDEDEYELEGIIRHTGSLIRGHYIAYVRKKKDKDKVKEKTGIQEEKESESESEWYEFDDDAVSILNEKRFIETVCNTKDVYILIYKRKYILSSPSTSSSTLSLSSSKNLLSLRQFLLSQTTLKRTRQTNDDDSDDSDEFNSILCIHKRRKLNISLADLNKRVVCLKQNSSQSLTLIDDDDDNDLLRKFKKCKVCLKILDELNTKREEENKLIKFISNSKKESTGTEEEEEEVLYLIDKSWFKEWFKFVKNLEMETYFGSNLPKKINNSYLKYKINNIKDIQLKQDYMLVNQYVWNSLSQIYGYDHELKNTLLEE